MFKLIFSLSLILWAVGSHAQTLLISDIDDTIKLANVKNLMSAASYAFDDQSEFTGMSQLYNIIVRDNPDTKVVYLSKAPHWLMSRTHRNFLENASFPEGEYIPRSQYSAETHKVMTLREILKRENPKRVILVGDNGEQDAQVYAQIVREFSPQGIQFNQYIHLVYRNESAPGKSSFLTQDQIGFVTPIEISLDLEDNRVLPASSVRWMIENIATHILKQPLYPSEGNVAFPYFMDCSNFLWKWNEKISHYPILISFRTKLIQRCGTSDVH